MKVLTISILRCKTTLMVSRTGNAKMRQKNVKTRKLLKVSGIKRRKPHTCKPKTLTKIYNKTFKFKNYNLAVLMVAK